MEGQMKTAALYARVSTRDKEQNPETQLLALRDYAARRSYTIVHEYVDHGVTGFTFETGDIDQLAKFMTKLVEDNNLCLEMGKNAHQKMLNEMSLERCSGIINRLYTQHDHQLKR